MSEDETWRQWRSLQQFDHLLAASTMTDLSYIEVDELLVERSAPTQTQTQARPRPTLRYPNAEIKQLQADAEETLHKGRAVSAADLFEQALLLFEAEPQADSRIKLALLNGLGHAQMQKGNRDEAEETFGRALNLARSEGDLEQAQQTYLGLGLVFNKQKLAGLALDNLREALALARSHEDQPGQAKILLEMGIAYVSQGMLHKAVACLIAARNLYTLPEIFPGYDDRKQADRTISEQLNEVRRQSLAINYQTGEQQYQSWVSEAITGVLVPE